jgi:hypothetical protein
MMAIAYPKFGGGHSTVGGIVLKLPESQLHLAFADASSHCGAGASVTS